MESRRVSFEPLENGLDYMLSVVEKLQGKVEARDLKYAILHLAAAIEVLLKARLAQEHWALVFRSIENAEQDAWGSAAPTEKRTVSSWEAMSRLEAVCGVQFSNRDKDRVAAAVRKRNQLQHYGLADSAAAVEAIAAEALEFLLTFISNELNPSEWGDLAQAVLAEVQKGLAEVRNLVSIRMESLRPQIVSQRAVVGCPNCRQDALVPGESCRCLFCIVASTPEKAAKAYAWSFLGESEYEAAKGRTDWSVYVCPQCEQETLVRWVAVAHPQVDSAWCCFAEGEYWDEGAMVFCDRCGTPILRADDRDICSDCWSAIME
jgi:hypothetical protein